MKIAIFSNFYNNHMSELSEELFSLSNGDFLFIEKTSIDNTRQKMGFKSISNSFVRKYDSFSNEEMIDIINNYDVIITGSNSDDIYKKRLRTGKLLFKISEHPFKGKIKFIKKALKRIKWRLFYKNKKNSFLLAMSSRCAGDFRGSAFKNRILNFGYFPVFDDHFVRFEDKTPNSFIWVGRMIWWKHPEIAVQTIKKLVDHGFKVNLTMVGADYDFDKTKTLIANLKLDDNIDMVGLKDQQSVRELLKKHRYFLFTSDTNEGWGVVLNEAMNSCCVCVASNEAGSSKILIDGYNGVLCKNSSDDYFDIISTLLLNKNGLNETMSENAFLAIKDNFNGKIAAQRLFEFSSKYLNSGETKYFESGIMSKQL